MNEQQIIEIAVPFLWLIIPMIGLISFYKIAFNMFGFKIESLYYLYFMLLTVSVLLYTFTFYDKTMTAINNIIKGLIICEIIRPSLKL